MALEDETRWNPKPSFLVVAPGPDGMLHVLVVEGEYRVTQQGTFRSLKGNVMSEQTVPLTEGGLCILDHLAVSGPRDEET